MSKRMTRRELFKDVGVAGATTILAVGSGKADAPIAQCGAHGQQVGQADLGQPGARPQGGEATPPTSHAAMGPHENHLVELTAGDMNVAFDQRYGSISSITKKGDPLGTNFIGNEHNTPGVDASNSRWTGDLVTQVWDITDTNPAHRHWSPRSEFILKGKWRPELTGRSGDIRGVSFNAGTFAVNYEGASKNEGGVRSFSLAMKYHRGEGDSLLWEVELRNVTDHVLEIGELAFPLMVNDDQGEFYRDPKTGQPFLPDETGHPLSFPDDSFTV